MPTNLPFWIVNPSQDTSCFDLPRLIGVIEVILQQDGHLRCVLTTNDDDSFDAFRNRGRRRQQEEVMVTTLLINGGS